MGSGEGSLILDRLINKDSRGRPFIPGSTLKGVIRESCEKLSRTLGFPEPSDPHQTDLTIQDNFRPTVDLQSPIDRIFGNKFEGGQLFFRDARLENDPLYNFRKTQARICKYRKLGTAKDKHLFSTEYAAPMVFKTTIEGHHENLVSIVETDPPFEYCLLIAGILNIVHLGGDKSTGCGKTEIVFDSIKFNEKPILMDTIFEYLDSTMYMEAKA
uniref:CRISPR type III-associated protein domain-containing protein n=1 Tax=uncultured Desulfobacterium sp. TaxID=201089 RepID=E1YMA9_9BACT|nr:hypothetical protein N47_E47540 [uncultured Desulfobacterium sp.]